MATHQHTYLIIGQGLCCYRITPCKWWLKQDTAGADQCKATGAFTSYRQTAQHKLRRYRLSRLSVLWKGRYLHIAWPELCLQKCTQLSYQMRDNMCNFSCTLEGLQLPQECQWKLFPFQHVISKTSCWVVAQPLACAVQRVPNIVVVMRVHCSKHTACELLGTCEWLRVCASKCQHRNTVHTYTLPVKW